MLTDCASCGTRYAPDLAACPHCGHPAGAGAPGEGDGEDGEEGELPKITHEGASFPGDRAPESIPDEADSTQEAQETDAAAEPPAAPVALAARSPRRAAPQPGAQALT